MSGITSAAAIPNPDDGSKLEVPTGDIAKVTTSGGNSQPTIPRLVG